MISLGKNWTNGVEDFLIPNEEHVSTLMVISAQVHHLEKWFSKSCFSCSRLVITAAPSAN